VPPSNTGPVFVLIEGAGPATVAPGGTVPLPLASVAIHVPQGPTVQTGMLSAPAGVANSSVTKASGLQMTTRNLCVSSA
jgi:hypothetical protein